ncbi:cobalamin biosynthesis protein [Actinoplanes sp. NPDC048796]|uniref:cobalamin biosynthesis protein n=1 Tax=unclassified Actinoplanes TaxID=2626549 RepID=UPI00340BFD62
MPGDLVLGLGARRGAGPAALRAAVDEVLTAAGLAVAAIGTLATVDRRAADPAVRDLASARGWRLAGLPAAELARRPVPHPSWTVASAVGTPSVAEAAALCAAGPDSVLLVPKTVVASVTVAIARPSAT